MHTEVFRRSEGVETTNQIQLARHYCNELHPRTSTSCDGVFAKVDIFLVNELSFEIVCPTVPIPVRDVDLYTRDYYSHERLFTNIIVFTLK